MGRDCRRSKATDSTRVRPESSGRSNPPRASQREQGSGVAIRRFKTFRAVELRFDRAVTPTHRPMDDEPTDRSGLAERDASALLDELEQMVAGARSFWIGRVSLNRKETGRLVEAIGERLDIRAGEARERAPETRREAARSVEEVAFENLAFLVNSGGSGGALYRLRYL